MHDLIKHGFCIAKNVMSKEWINHILQDIEQTALDIDVTGIRHIDKKLNSVSAYLVSAEFSEITKYSSKSIEPSQRRVLHLEFSDWVLPEDVQKTLS